MSLTALDVKNASCEKGKKQSKKSDGNGLFLLIKNNGSKLWRFRFKFNKKHQEMAFGQYPTLTLAQARKLAEEARFLLMQGINPMDERRERKQEQKIDEEKLFSTISMKWWEQQKDSWSEEHAIRVKKWLTQDAAMLSDFDIEKIDAGHITELMLSIEAAGTPRKAPNILSIINRIFGFALAHRLTRHNPAAGLPLSDILKPMPKVKHRAAIIDKNQLSELIKDIDSNIAGGLCTIEALKLIPRIFLRPKEIRCLKWSYIDFEDRLIRIPAEEMKKDREHLVPLAKQVCSQLQNLHSLTGYSEYVFPNERDASKPMSKNVMTNSLRALGYSADIMSAHGFRATASTILHEQGWNHDVIETQLAHLVGTATSRAYDRSIYLTERKKMMQEWADCLDELARLS